MSLIKSTATIGGFTLISRLFGFIRDVLQATIIGANAYSDAFFIAFKLPNFFRRIFAEGAFNAAFVPLYAGKLQAEGREAALTFAAQVFAVLLTALLVLTALMITIMPWFMLLLAPGFHDTPEVFALATDLTRLTFPYLLFISLVTLLGGILNSVEKFAAVAATPILMNICFIASLLLVAWWQPIPEVSVIILALGVSFSGICQFVWLALFCRRAGLMPRLTRPRLTPDVRKLLKVMGPAVLGGGVAQINLMVDVILASFLPNAGAISYLYYADRISELPLAVIGIAMGAALLPLLSKQVKAGDLAKAQHTQNRGIEFSLLFALPAAVGIGVLAEPIIATIYERGAFDAADTAATAPALMVFAMGLPAFVLIKVLAPGFYAHHDTKTPFLIASGCILLNFVLNLLLMGTFAHVGMAMATTSAAWVNALAMLVILQRRNLFHTDAGLRRRLPRMVLACALMGITLAAAQMLIAGHFGLDTNGGRAASLLSLITCGGTLYAALCLTFRVVTLQEMRGYMSRKR